MRGPIPISCLPYHPYRAFLLNRSDQLLVCRCRGIPIIEILVKAAADRSHLVLHVRISVLHVCISVLHVCISVLHVCISVLHVRISAPHVCISVLHVCISVLHACISVLHVCISVLHGCISVLHVCISVHFRRMEECMQLEHPRSISALRARLYLCLHILFLHRLKAEASQVSGKSIVIDGPEYN